MNSYSDPTGVRVLSVRVKAAEFLKVDFTFGFLDCKNMVVFKEAADVWYLHLWSLKLVSVVIYIPAE